MENKINKKNTNLPYSSNRYISISNKVLKSSIRQLSKKKDPERAKKFSLFEQSDKIHIESLPHMGGVKQKNKIMTDIPLHVDKLNLDIMTRK
jgi:hypothetical protein